jgi:nicotinamidase-related amidase
MNLPPGRSPPGFDPTSRGMTPWALAVEPSRAALLVIDVQERLAAAMPPEAMAALTRNLVVLCEAAGRFGLPVVASQQYPRGLGATIGPVEDALAALPPDLVHRFDKVEFSACAAPASAGLWPRLARDTWIVAGMETHVCVYQTVRHLREGGAAVHVVRDAVLSRSDENRATGLALIERTGAVITSTEVVVFDLLQKAGTEDFKALSRLIR